MSNLCLRYGPGMDWNIQVQLIQMLIDKEPQTQSSDADGKPDLDDWWIQRNVPFSRPIACWPLHGLVAKPCRLCHVDAYSMMDVRYTNFMSSLGQVMFGSSTALSPCCIASLDQIWGIESAGSGKTQFYTVFGHVAATGYPSFVMCPFLHERNYIGWPTSHARWTIFLKASRLMIAPTCIMGIQFWNNQDWIECVVFPMIEGSLEVKLPTIWRDRKAEVGSVREEKLRDGQDQRGRKSEERRCRCAKR